MDRKFSELTYYEMLDVKPQAVLFEIRHAYQNALAMYESGSMVSYSFISEEERKDILARIEEAYLTLSSDQKRQAYDAELIRRGLLPRPGAGSPAQKKPVSVFDIGRGGPPRPATQRSGDLRAKIAQNPRIAQIVAQSDITGADLQEIRCELCVEVEQIAAETKVRSDYLHAIESSDKDRLPAPVFLKGFVKAYLKYLGFEQVEEMSAKVMNAIAR